MKYPRYMTKIDRLSRFHRGLRYQISVWRRDADESAPVLVESELFHGSRADADSRVRALRREAKGAACL